MVPDGFLSGPALNPGSQHEHVKGYEMTCRSVSAREAHTAYIKTTVTSSLRLLVYRCDKTLSTLF